jgi:hypothetical protein
MLYPIYFHYPFTFHRGVGNLGVVQNSEHRLRVIVTLANVAIHFFAVETINEVATSGGLSFWEAEVFSYFPSRLTY